jgi:hypothetical protein
MNRRNFSQLAGIGGIGLFSSQSIFASNSNSNNQFEFLSIWYTDNFVFFLLNLIQSKGGLLSASIFILNVVVHFELFEDGSRRELRQLLFQ